MTIKRASSDPSKEAHGLYMVEKYERVIRQRRKLRLLLAHNDHDGWRRSQIAWMGHIRHGDGQNGLKHLGLALPC